MFGAQATVCPVVEEKGIFFGAFVVQLAVKYSSQDESLKFLSKVDSHFNSNLVQINFAHVESFKAQRRDNTLMHAHVSFISDGFGEVVSGTSYVVGGKVRNYTREKEFSFLEKLDKSGLLAITFFSYT